MKEATLSEGERFLDILNRGGYKVSGCQVSFEDKFIALTGENERGFFVSPLYASDNAAQVDRFKSYCEAHGIEVGPDDLRSDEKRMVIRVLRSRG